MKDVGGKDSGEAMTSSTPHQTPSQNIEMEAILTPPSEDLFCILFSDIEKGKPLMGRLHRVLFELNSHSKHYKNGYVRRGFFQRLLEQGKTLNFL